MAAFKRYEGSGTSLQTLKETASGTTDVVIGLLVCNAHATDTATVDVELSDTKVGGGVKIPAGGSVEFCTGKFVLEAGDKVEVAPTGGTVLSYLSVLEGV